MKRRKALSLLLSLAIVLSLVLPVTTAFAADGDTNEDETKTSGLSINKTAVYDAKNDAYTITLEAYATGEKTTTVVSKDIPTDIILLLDQSGSMSKTFSTATEDSWLSYGKQQNSTNYNLRMNNNDRNAEKNLYYKLSDGGYVEVSVDRTSETVRDYVVWQNTKNSQCYNSSDDIYVNTEEGFKKVTVKYSLSYPITYTYTYTLNNDTVVTNTSTRMDGDPPYKIYRLQDTYEYTYKYYYTVNGVRTTIGEQSKGADTIFDEELYQYVPSGTSITRQEALLSTVRGFLNSVSEKAKGADGAYGTDDDVNHRIAVVKFTAKATDLTSGLVDMDAADGLTTVVRAVNNLSTGGDTQPSTALDTANSIFKDNPVESGERNRVVILFTDGYPAESQTDCINYTWCDSAIESAYTSKKTYGATVYTVGIYDGANPDSDINTNFEYGNRDKSTLNTKQLVAANRYMHYTSNNYPNAQSLQNGGERTGSGYYLSAADMDSLNSIFQQISDNLPSGGSSTTLDGNTVVKDIISPYFTLPKDANTNSIRLTTYDCTAKTGDTYTWGNPQDAKTSGVTADVNGNQVSVTGFNFSENWCGLDKGANGNETVRGKKLVISFEVEPKSGFLGGYSVDTNGGAYIYENADAKEPLMEFEKPKVDVTIPDVGVTAEDKNVYLLGEVTLNQLKSGAVVKADDGSENGIPIDLSKANDPNEPYGLEKWQTDYVDINVAVKNGNADVTDKIESLTEDTTYKIIVTVSPKQGTVASGIGPTVTAKSGSSADGNIYVFKPELTFADFVGYYGDTAPAHPHSLTDIKWKHEGTTANEEAMGKAPELGISYASDSNNFLGDKINTKKDIPVKVDVTLKNENVNNYTKFVHGDCNVAGCTWKDTADTAKGNPAFLIHVKTCTLTITKAGNVANEPFVFTVSKDGAKYTEVTVKGNDRVTIVELPVGIYSITEDTGWSWRYAPSYDKENVELSASNPTGTITCTNTKGNDQWLNDYGVISNIYGKPNTPATDGNN